MMQKILKGDTSGAIALALADGFDYSNATVEVRYQGAVRTFKNCTAGQTLTFMLTAEETAPMALGAYPVTVRIGKADGSMLTVTNAGVKIAVTDCVEDVRAGGAIIVDARGGLYGVDDLPAHYTVKDLRAKINEIISKLGGGVAALCLLACTAFGAGVTAHKATLEDLDASTDKVVTNVTFDASGLATSTDVQQAEARVEEKVNDASNNVMTAAHDTFRTLIDNEAHATVERWEHFGIPSNYSVKLGPLYKDNKWYLSLKNNNIFMTENSTDSSPANARSLTFVFANFTVRSELRRIATEGKYFVTDDNVPNTNGFVTAQAATNAAEAVVHEAVNEGVADWAKAGNDKPNGMTANAVVLTNNTLTTKDGVKIIATNVGAVETNAYWTVKKLYEGGIGIRPSDHGPEISCLFIGYLSHGNIENGGSWNYYNGSSESFLYGSYFLLNEGSKPWIQNAEDFKIGGSFYDYGTSLPTWVDGRADNRIAAAGHASSSDLETLAGTVATVSAKADQANLYSSGVYQYMIGNTNAWFAETNYVTNAEITNRTQFAWEDEMNAGTVPGSMAMWEIRDGQRQRVWDQRDWTAWYWSFKAEQLSNSMARVIGDVADEVSTNCMRRGWAKYTAVRGLDNPDPSALVVDTPKVQLFAGHQWEKLVETGGAGYWTLTGNGIELSAADTTNTFLTVKDFEGNACLTFRKKSSYLVYCECGTDITSNYMDGQGRVVFHITTDVQPTAEFSTTLDLDDFVEQGESGCPANYEWTGSAGNWDCHFLLKPGIVANSCFARFKVMRQGENIVEHTIPIKINGGIIFDHNGQSVKIRPTVTSTAVGSAVNWVVAQ